MSKAWTIDPDLIYLLQIDGDIAGYFRKKGLLYGNSLRDFMSEIGIFDNNINSKIKQAVRNMGLPLTVLSEHKKGKVNVYAPTHDVAIGIVERLVRSTLVYGHGVNDVTDTIYTDEGKIKPCYRKWCGMLERCYSPKWHKNKPSYQDCYVAPEWLLFSNFKRWFDEHNQPNTVLDKDILQKGNKIYSEETCLFVPEFINTLFIKRQGDRGGLPIGVTYSRAHKLYSARVSKNSKRITVGLFKDPHAAFLAYKKAKEAYVKEVAQEYFEKGLIDWRVFEALCRYEVGVED